MSMTSQDDSWRHDLVHYPLGHLIGVLWDGQKAERAAQSLHDAGYTDVVVLDGAAALEAIRNTEHTANPVARAWERLSLYLSGEADSRQAALDALSRGHAIVMVYAPDRPREDQAATILRTHGARAVRSFGRWTITELGR